MVAHAVYIGVSLPATTEVTARGAATARHVAGGTAGRAAWSIGRPAAMAVAEAATHRGIPATRHGTVAVVAPVYVTIVIVMMISVVVMIPIVVVVVMAALAHARVGAVEVVSGIETAGPMAVATLEGHEHCGTVKEHPSDTVAGVDGEGRTGVGPNDGTVKPLAGHVEVILPGAEHIAQVAVADVPPDAEDVGTGIEVEQVVEVDLIHCIILCCCESELVSHLVTEEEGLVACCGVRHCCGGDGYRHHHHHGQDLLHCLIVLMVQLFFLIFGAKVVQTECRVKLACYAEVQPTFAFSNAKVV